MKISQLIPYLEEIRNEQGDLNVCVSVYHEYWGSLESHLTERNISISEHAQPNGPRSVWEKAVIFEY